MNTTTNPLPDIHPGTPKCFHIRAELVLIRETDKAFQVALSRDVCKTAWLPKSQAVITRRHEQSPIFTLPQWLYKRLQQQL